MTAAGLVTIAKDPDLEPLAVGVKTTVTKQADPGATMELQPLAVQSPGFVPVKVNPVEIQLDDPVFATVIT